ncbi:MAG: threonylcarbamoyl-AMP synthase [Actinobacteria bacterium]|uniref:L-threonylcarbamoyladenylate synthase n=1 Tax=freshwater metagenome TaxID=449393 RepID=A0A6J7I7V6_9ZZZZ|nr:threonylcarbamoyl-AMP synthase [Actinomycetota bacterium]MSX86568.1 threonylcarbamoyl-AMP synthase [Actinomycetota bacterium]MSY70857.1 threonylcarbamoyl-AMP synthase [Actinomycetota bacterium]
MIVPVDDAFGLALDALRRGGVVVLPTETVYGLVARAGDRGAIERLFVLKNRPDSKTISVLVGDLEQARALTPDDLDACAPWWPGPLTAVVRRRADAELYLGADATTIGLRCPDHPFVRRLALDLGPLAATSANRTGEPTPASAAEVALVFPDVALVVDDGPRDGLPSTVIDLTTSPPTVLRAGPIPGSVFGAR